MTYISSSTQLSTFTLLRGLVVSNSTLSVKFNLNNVFEFQPRHKSSNFCGFPYMIIKTPESDDPEEYLGNQVRLKEFDVEIIIRMDYLARDNFTTYASALVALFDSATANSTMIANGYNIIKIESGKPEPITMDQKELIEGTFTLMLEGDVV